MFILSSLLETQSVASFNFFATPLRSSFLLKSAKKSFKEIGECGSIRYVLPSVPFLYSIGGSTAVFFPKLIAFDTEEIDIFFAYFLGIPNFCCAYTIAFVRSAPDNLGSIYSTRI